MLSELINRTVHSIDFPKIEGRDSFVAWLKFAHGIMNVSRPLLILAAASTTDGALREYYLRHGDEERHHAEWMEADLAVLGEKTDIVDYAVAATAGAQYYYLRHVGPHALLGYCAAMEFRPMPLDDVDALAKIVGENAMRTVRLHSTSDIDHGAALAAMIDQQQDHADLITYSALVTRKMLAFFLKARMCHA